MGIRVSDFSKEFEKQIAGGANATDAFNKAVSKAGTEKSKKDRRYKKYSEMALTEKVAAKLKELFYGPKTYSKRKFGK